MTSAAQPQSARVALVTGATQGLGLALVQGLARRLNPTDVVLLTSRNAERVAAVAARCAGAAGAVARVQGRPLDVTDSAAVAALARQVADEYGGLDYVFSNAGARMSPDIDAVKQIDLQLDTSNVATSQMLRDFLPLLRPGGSFIVVASGVGTLGQLPEPARPRFPDDATLDQVDAVVEEYRAEVLAGTAQEHGWPQWFNIPSKVAQVAATRAVARGRREQDVRQGTLLAGVCPGLIDTDASRPWFSDMSTAQTPEQAAVAILDLALNRPFDPATYGELVQFGKVLPWTGKIETGHNAAG